MNIEQKYIDRFWSKVVKTPSGCWEWAGARNMRGYGKITVNGKKWSTHRLSMILAGHDIAGLLVCHHCDNPPCVNPDHLFVGTQQDNMTDMTNKGRSRHPLTNDEARAIRSEARFGVRGRYGNGNITELARRYNVARSTIGDIARHKTYRNI